MAAYTNIAKPTGTPYTNLSKPIIEGYTTWNATQIVWNDAALTWDSQSYKNIDKPI